MTSHCNPDYYRNVHNQKSSWIHFLNQAAAQCIKYREGSPSILYIVPRWLHVSLSLFLFLTHSLSVSLSLSLSLCLSLSLSLSVSDYHSISNTHSVSFYLYYCLSLFLLCLSLYLSCISFSAFVWISVYVVLFCLILSCLVLSCLVLSCLVLSCLFLPIDCLSTVCMSVCLLKPLLHPSPSVHYLFK